MPTRHETTEGPRPKRDPQARRRAIVRAAADLLVEDGELTHRRAAERAQVPLGATTYYFSSLEDLREAALELLAQEINDDLAEIGREAVRAEGRPEVLAALLHDYLADTAQIRADAALYTAAVHRPALRPLATRWFEGFVEMLSAWTDPGSARAIAMFVDGASLHALLQGEPLDLETLTRTLTVLMRPASEEA
ncbi:TetR family transcriptional regulator [Streptomyces harbinensis]|uniref:TetR/AcrR family transcriptional regulator n=1 Tax=Streptomyces harbinensis TaxID=1176198 RepID=UPI003395A5AA